MLTVSIPKCTIIYNRTAKIYMAVNGQEVARGTKQACQLAALEHDALDIFDEVMAIIQNFPPAKERAIKAGFILRDGLLLPPQPFDVEGTYMNEIGRVGQHVVTWNNGFCSCDCHDFMLQNAPILPSRQRACKHILAVLIASAMGDGQDE